MRVYEVAREFKVEAEKMLTILRGMGARVTSEASQVDDATVAKLRARLERERRAGHTDLEVSLEAVVEDAQPAGKRRRRRKEDIVEEPAPEPAEPVAEADSTADVAADAADAIAAEAAEEAAAAGEDVAEAIDEVAARPEVEVVAAEAQPEAPEVEPAPEPEEVAEPVAEAPEPEPAADEPAAEPEAPAEPAQPPIQPVASAKPLEDSRPRNVPTEAQKPKLRRAAEVLGKTPPRQSPSPAASAAPGGQVRIQAEGFTPDGRRAAPSQSAGAGASAGGGAGGKKDRKKKKQRRVDQDAVQENIARVMSELKTGGKKRRHRREEAPGRVSMEQERQRRAAEEATTVRVNEFLTVSELSQVIDVPATQIVASAFKNLGLMVTINQRLDFDQIELLLEEFGFRAVREEEYAGEAEETETPDKPEDLQPRPPIVTIMGHVDHGKTSLLDYIRKTNVIAGESGGITQHIGAYHVDLQDGRSITFLDTPGHAAFTAMRARGAELTDIVVLVVAADDSVMPQTIEAISHAKNAGVPIIVAVNKIDLPGADPSKIKQDLLQQGVVVEEFGGDVLSADVSAKKGTGVDDLLDKILLQAEVLDLKANPDRGAHGTVVEAQLDVGKGAVATVLVTNGTLKVGDSFVCGHYDGRIRAMLDERGKPVNEAGPGIPVQILGIAGVPGAGDGLIAMDADRASEISGTRQRLEREKQLRIKSRGVKLTDISRMLAEGKTATLNLIIKGDVDGSVQALSDSLLQLGTSEVKVEVIHRGVGAINESDVLLATSAGAVVIGFHVRPTAEARQVAAREGVDVKLYSIIYEAVEDVRAALEGMLAPEEKEVLLGVAEVRQLFKVPRVGTIAGCYVTEGTIERKGRVRVVREAVQVYEGELGSLKRFKDDVREVREGFECGLNVEGFNDIKIGDHIECYRVESVARTLASSANADK
ncbi:MAG TPA: translation initiation factor IF-2 [Longimicrobiales bacterium]|nr:translation initiation factor IF-2 [Longimicrobiales bacterium]